MEVSIKKAYDSILKKEMDVREYIEYSKEHPSNIKALQCVECGDIITFCEGKQKQPYFRHSKGGNNHNYCSLYHEGKESQSNEAKVRKKIFHEENITLNYELLYKNGTWRAFLTIPPFSDEEIEANEKNQTSIVISYSSYSENIIPINYGQFSAGEIKHIATPISVEPIEIKVKGNSTSQNISYTLDGFKPKEQIYSSLIIQDFVSNFNEDILDLSEMNSFACKKIKGFVYTGRHYIVFSEAKNFRASYIGKRSIEIKPIQLNPSNEFKYYIFDVMFNAINDDSKNFCHQRNCELIEKNEATILWPPIKKIGNYRYYNEKETKIYVLFQNQSKALIIEKYDIIDPKTNKANLFFKVTNNSESFYVSLDKKRPVIKTNALFESKDIHELKLEHDNFTDTYLLNTGVLIQKYDSSCKLKKDYSLLFMNSQLDHILGVNNREKNIEENKLLKIIRYSIEYMNFNNQYYDFLNKKYENNDLVKQYLEICNRTKTIKKEALIMLMNEVN